MESGGDADDSAYFSDRSLRVVGNLATWAAGLPVLAELNRREIPFIVLKSLPQLEELYQDIGARVSTDIDILVPGAHAVDAFDLVLEQGWWPLEGNLLTFLTRRRSRDIVIPSRPWHFKLSRSDVPSGLDLHFDSMAAGMKPVLDQRVWERALPRFQDGVRFLVLSPEDRLLLVCQHFLIDAVGNPRVSWVRLTDIDNILLQSGELDRVYLAQRARDSGVSIAFRLACGLAAARSPRTLPDWWRSVPVASVVRWKILDRILKTEPDRLNPQFASLIRPLIHDRPHILFRPWLQHLVPSRATVADLQLHYWPSWPEYLLQLVKIYQRRLRKLLGREAR